jgi:hypothetical protein
MGLGFGGSGRENFESPGVGLGIRNVSKWTGHSVGKWEPKKKESQGGSAIRNDESGGSLPPLGSGLKWKQIGLSNSELGF